MSTRRCPACGGLVSADLEWCSQCFTRFDDGGPETALEEEAAEGEAPGRESPAGGRPAEAGAPAKGGTGRAVRVVEEGRVLWDCPVCGQENDLETSVCSRCGTTFGRLFEEPVPPPRISPQRAALLSLLVPGAGHVAAGHAAEGVARAVIFAFTLGMVVAILAAGGLGGPLVPLVALFVGAAATLYLATAVDAYRAVRREPPVLSTRLLLIGATVLLLVAVAVLIIGGQRLT